MENLILTTAFSGPPTLLHLLHKFINVKNPGFELTRDAKWLKCVTFFPVSVCTFILFLHQDFQGKQGWLLSGHAERRSVDMSPRHRCVPLSPVDGPHTSQPSAKDGAQNPLYIQEGACYTLFSLEATTAFQESFKWRTLETILNQTILNQNMLSQTNLPNRRQLPLT